MVEEFALPAAALGPVVVRPFFLSVDFEPFLLRADPPEDLQRSPGVQALIGPTGHHIGRGFNALEGNFVCPGVFGAT